MAKKQQIFEKLQLHLEMNTSFFQELHQLMQWQERSPEEMEHLKNALELYATVVEGIAQGKSPAMVEGNGIKAHKMVLPPLLAQFKYEQEVAHSDDLDLKKKLL